MSLNISQINELTDAGIRESWKLTDKKQKFALAYIKTGGNRAQSLKIAGYKTKKKNYAIHACQILKDPILKKYIDKTRSEMEEKLKLDAEWVLKRHKKVVEQFIPLADEAVLDVKEVGCGQNSLDAVCKIGGLYKKEAEKPDDNEDLERAKEYAREHAKEF